MEQILLIDDDLQIRQLLEEVLRDKGFDVIAAESVERGFPDYPKSTASLIVMDVLMPDREGLATIRELRKHNPNLKIMAISGGLPKGGLDVLDIAKRFGADRVLRKPFDVNEFLTVIYDILNVDQGFVQE